MCQCKGGYVCPIHIPKAQAKSAPAKKARGMSIRDAIEVMGKNKIGRRFSHNSATSVAAKVLMGAYRAKHNCGCSLSIAISYFSRPKTSKFERYEINSIGRDDHYAFIQKNGKTFYINSEGDEIISCFTDKSGIGGHFQSRELVEAAVRKHKEKQNRKNKSDEEYRILASQISKYSLTIEREVSPYDSSQIMDPVKDSTISYHLRLAGYEKVYVQNVLLDNPIKEIGVYTVKLKFTENIRVDLKVWVVPKAEVIRRGRTNVKT